jgi:hypothetical protein
MRTEGLDDVPLREFEVILRVAFFHPTQYTKTQVRSAPLRTWRILNVNIIYVNCLAQEFLVLGSQPLTALKDRVYCLQNKQLDGPHTPSSFFFIEGKFYNDLRDPRAISYSESVSIIHYANFLPYL